MLPSATKIVALQARVKELEAQLGVAPQAATTGASTGRGLGTDIAAQYAALEAKRDALEAGNAAMRAQIAAVKASTPAPTSAADAALLQRFAGVHVDLGEVIGGTAKLNAAVSAALRNSPISMGAFRQLTPRQQLALSNRGVQLVDGDFPLSADARAAVEIISPSPQSKAMKRDTFFSMSPHDQTAHVLAGGTVVD